MSIRKRLTVVFVLIIALVSVSGGLTYLGRPIIEGAFRRSFDALYSLNAIRELRSHINSQRVSISRYLLIDDSKELISFEEASRASLKNLEDLKKQLGPNPPDWFAELTRLCTDVSVLSQRVIDLYKRGNKFQAHDEFGAKLTPLFVELFDKVDGLERSKSSEADATFNTIRSLLEKGGVAIVVMLIIVVIAGIILFRSLYRAVMIPLEVLRRGTEEFGKGHWDHRITLSAHNEFGVLAKSFNTMAENVKQLQLQAAHLDRMSAVGQLAGGVAHEINNPLTAVLGQAQIMLTKMSDGDPGYATLKKIENAGLRCKRIVRGLLDFSRPMQLAFDHVDVNETIKATLDLCEADLKKHRVTVTRNFFPSLPKIQANSSELQQVLLNLINNAMQAMQKGGVLTIETLTHKRPLQLSERRKGSPPRMVEGPWVEIRVTDTGIGISEIHLTKIFEPFFTTKEIGQGTGLGLAVSLGIVQKHGGDISVESHGLNSGACFTVTLPLKLPHVAQPIQSNRAHGGIG